MYENIKPLKVNIISDVHYYAREMGCEGKAFDKANVKKKISFTQILNYYGRINFRIETTNY